MVKVLKFKKRLGAKKYGSKSSAFKKRSLFKPSFKRKLQKFSKKIKRGTGKFMSKKNRYRSKIKKGRLRWKSFKNSKIMTKAKSGLRGYLNKLKTDIKDVGLAPVILKHVVNTGFATSSCLYNKRLIYPDELNVLCTPHGLPTTLQTDSVVGVMYDHLPIDLFTADLPDRSVLSTSTHMKLRYTKVMHESRINPLGVLAFYPPMNTSALACKYLSNILNIDVSRLRVMIQAILFSTLFAKYDTVNGVWDLCVMTYDRFYNEIPTEYTAVTIEAAISGFMRHYFDKDRANIINPTVIVKCDNIQRGFSGTTTTTVVRVYSVDDTPPEVLKFKWSATTKDNDIKAVMTSLWKSILPKMSADDKKEFGATAVSAVGNVAHLALTPSEFEQWSYIKQLDPFVVVQFLSADNVQRFAKFVASVYSAGVRYINSYRSDRPIVGQVADISADKTSVLSIYFGSMSVDNNYTSSTEMDFFHFKDCCKAGLMSFKYTRKKKLIYKPKTQSNFVIFVADRNSNLEIVSYVDYDSREAYYKLRHCLETDNLMRYVTHKGIATFKRLEPSFSFKFLNNNAKFYK